MLGRLPPVNGLLLGPPAGYRFPREVIAVAVRWYLRYGLSYRDVEELLAERGITVDHVTVYRWVQTFTPAYIDAARSARHVPGSRWFVDETYVKVAGRWIYLYRGGRSAQASHRRHGVGAAQRRRGAGVLHPSVAPGACAGRGHHRQGAGLFTCARRGRLLRTARHRAAREQHDRSRPRTTQSQAAADARTQMRPVPADCRGRSRVPAEPPPRPLRTHHRPPPEPAGPRRVPRTSRQPVGATRRLPAAPRRRRSTNATEPSDLPWTWSTSSICHAAHISTPRTAIP